MAEFCKVEREGRLWIVTINRPEVMNSLHPAANRELAKAWDDFEADPEAWVGIITGAGDRAFSAGNDLKYQASGGDMRGQPESGFGGLTQRFGLTKPVIAAVNGVAAGGGFVLAAMCDVRIASSAASFTSIFTKRGLVAEHGTTWIVPRLIGVGRALDLLWTSRKIDAREALRIGLVEYVVPPEELVAEATRYVRTLADTVSPATLADTKRMVYAHASLGYPEALRDVDEVQWRAVVRPDAIEGANALLEKRAPRFARLGKT